MVRERAFSDYKQASGSGKLTMQGFTKKLRSFVELCPWVSEMNPKDFQNSQGRIIRREEGGAPGAAPVEMIYLRKKDLPPAPPCEGKPVTKIPSL